MNFKASALILPLLVTLPLGGCFTSTYTHGHVITSDMLNQVQVGSSREQVELVLGTPSTTSSLNGDAYYYISQKTATTAFMAPDIVEQRVVAVYFDKDGYVQDLGNYSLEDGKIVDIVTRKTRTGGADYGFLTQILRGATNPSLGL
ncbi:MULTISPECIES: outer membrane protein assembly factor BamE [Stappiaceae]|jgi:outer membrane protein assembly factor BamE (lipoprotein component of BamABCDE complex)|uniref:SmpA / OmlA family protein n=3 Tax=Roseibium TaxID=150830 RepID=A0A0M6XXA2_9HYPH|nr:MULTISPECIES: outer membrane protein assembly factor BamE [Stappiaceae]MCR9282672.1 outer membrane protein assembly factor BamE [Paracoccaceae bacterium]MEC9420417.1 outer membrane protein assembly factor BamE [Pseudomonadota bacterium]MEE4012583.1 outer membrane protein assembly factor BamE [Roseibium sp. FZY0029]AMN53997.1 membrane protein SmpA [Labrenzia sp. CP4]AQQ02476.1 cell envelope protein SmpA [Roseibium aggregatum]